jgi:NADH-quinone oxidoreductase subunit F
VDIRLIPGAVPSAAERSAVDGILGPPGQAPRGREAWARRPLLLPALHALQSRAGWISPGGLNHVCERLCVPPAEAFGVASFYAMFSMERRPLRVVHVCDDIACRTAGALELAASLERKLGPEGRAWLRSPCLGQCERAPAALFQAAGERPGEWSLAPAGLEAVLAGLEPDAAPGPPPAPLGRQPAEGLRLLRRVGRADPERLEDYLAHGGYASLARAFDRGPEGVVREVIASRLVGRGGAAFPTGRKWEEVARAAARPHYLVLNADESEPGTFKDRVLMEEDPFAVIEAMTIAGYATGSEEGFVYVRGEYPLAAARLAKAIGQARAGGFLGSDIRGSGFRFDVELRRGAGAYICGEETALFNSIEGFRGEPRQKPPFPTQAGLFGRPTAVNNVETVVNVLDIVREGGAAFASVGSGQSTGTKLFCLSGAVERPGLYEVPFGATLRELLALAGGVREGRKLQAVLLGGAAGVFVTPEEIDVPLTFEGTRAIGATIGSGVVMAFDDRADLGDILVRIAAFFRDESCGQCVPCRVGTVRQEEALVRLAAGKPLGSADSDLALVGEVGQVMRDASICGLGQTASSAVASAIRKLRPFGGRRP